MNGKNSVGLLVYERPINAPLELAPYVYDALLKDIDFAVTKSGHEKAELFGVDFVVMVVRLRWCPKGAVMGPEGQGRHKGSDGLLERAKSEKEEEEENEEEEEVDETLPQLRAVRPRKKMEMAYEHFEDMLFVKAADFQFDFERNDKVWIALVIKMDAFKQAVKHMTRHPKHW